MSNLDKINLKELSPKIFAINRDGIGDFLTIKIKKSISQCGQYIIVPKLAQSTLNWVS